MIARLRRRLPGRTDGPDRDRGSISLEIAILGPVLLLLIFTIVQFGLWFYARNLALAAAQEGVTAARAYGASPGAGVTRARTFLDQQAGDSLTQTVATSSGSTATRVRIEVTGRALSIIPGLPGLQVTQSADAPVERFTTATTP